MEPVTGNVCPICGKIYQKPGYLESHIRTVHMGEKHPGMFRCGFCLKEFQSNTNRLMHERKMHPSQASGVASYASTSRETPQRTPQSSRQHFPGQVVNRRPSGGKKTSTKKFICSECPALFDLQIALRMHYQRIHPRPPIRVKEEPTEHDSIRYPESRAVHIADTESEKNFFHEDAVQVIKREPVPNRHVGQAEVARPRNDAASTSRRSEERSADPGQKSGEEETLEQEVLLAKQDLVKAKGQLVRANKALVQSRRELVETKKELLEAKVRLAAKGKQNPVVKQNANPWQLPYSREHAEPSHGNRQNEQKTQPAQSRANETQSSNNVTSAKKAHTPHIGTEIPDNQKHQTVTVEVSARGTMNGSIANQAAPRKSKSVAAPHRSVTLPSHKPLTHTKSAPTRIKEPPTPASRNVIASARCTPFHRTPPRNSSEDVQSTVRPSSSESSHRGASAFHRVIPPKTKPTVQPSVTIDENFEVKYETFGDFHNSDRNQTAHDLENEEHGYMDTYDEAREEASEVFNPLQGEEDGLPNFYGESDRQPETSQLGRNSFSSGPQPGTSGLSGYVPDTTGTRKRYVRSDSMCRCEYCGKQFTNISNMIVHRRIHTGERPYECNYCNKKFSSKVAVTSHTRTHTKPFICSVCGMRFAGNAQLRNHFLKYHPRHQ